MYWDANNGFSSATKIPDSTDDYSASVWVCKCNICNPLAYRCSYCLLIIVNLTLAVFVDTPDRSERANGSVLYASNKKYSNTLFRSKEKLDGSSANQIHYVWLCKWRKLLLLMFNVKAHNLLRCERWDWGFKKHGFYQCYSGCKYVCGQNR